MKKTIVSVIVAAMAVVQINAQAYIVSGYIENCETGERLVNASVYSTLTGKGTVSNEFGYFSYQVAASTDSLIVSHIGFSSRAIATGTSVNKTLTVCLKENTTLNEVVISDERQVVRQDHTEYLDIELIKQLPSLDGEADIMKAYQLMPGIASGTEGTNGIYVRGGSSDQNLVLLDDVPLYYTGHFGGFVSVFNNAAISSSKVQKSGFDARYSGRLSSVVDVRTKNGNMKKRTGSFHIGTLSSGFATEGPIVKNESSYLVTYRGSNLGMLMRAGSQFTDNQTANIGFHDLNVKLNSKLSEKDRLYFSLYSGKDNLRVDVLEKSEDDTFFEQSDFIDYTAIAKTKSAWGNSAASVRLNHIYSPKVFSSSVLYASNFGYTFNSGFIYEDNATETTPLTIANTLNSSITETAFQHNISWAISNKLSVNSGFQGQYFISSPKSASQTLELTKEGADFIAGEIGITQGYATSYKEKNIDLFNFSGYTDASYNFMTNYTLYTGLRYGAVVYGSNATEFVFEPRLRLKAKYGNGFSAYVDYAKMSQPLHYLVSNLSGLPSDVWLPASENLPVERSEQLSANFSWHLPAKLELSVAGFHKKMSSLISYKGGEDLFTAGNFVDKTYQSGTGKVIGAEIYVSKEKDWAQAILSYTFTKNTRQFQELNLGSPFPYRYAKKHDISVAIIAKLTKRTSVSAVWYYSSGNFITLAEFIYPSQIVKGTMPHHMGSINPHDLVATYDTYLATYTSDVNNYQMPNYHRLDINLNIATKKQKGEWNVGVYNAYNKLNPFYVYFVFKSEWDKPQFEGLAVFPILPSVSYSYKF